MSIDRYVRPANFTASPLSDPLLQELDWILEDPALFALVRQDLAQHYQRSSAGRPPVAVEVTLRMTVLRRRKKWSYRQAEQEVRDGPGYRQWVRVYDHPVPDHTTLNDLERLIRPPTLHRLNDRLLVLAQTYRITQGYKLRLDSSVSATQIRYPVDSGLLLDGVRVLSRLLERAAPWLPAALRRSGVCSNHLRSARRRARHIGKLARAAKPASGKPPKPQVKKRAVNKAYAELIQIARTTLNQAQRVVEALGTPTEGAPLRLVKQLTEFLPLVQRAIDQAVRRVLQGESVPAADKIVSLFEPHTQILRRGKAPPQDTEFGHKVNYAEVEHGLISAWEVVAQGNPPDERMLPPFLRQHCKRFGHAPRVLAGDRGVFSPANERLAQQLGVAQIALPQTGQRSAARTAHEKQRWFKKGQRFRNGIEGRISVITRTVQLKRCPYQGLDGFERWVGWGIFVANLVVMARALHKRRHRKRRTVKVQK